MSIYHDVRMTDGLPHFYSSVYTEPASTSHASKSRVVRSLVEFMNIEQASVCETIKRLGFAQNNQVHLYGKVFDLTSDPFSIGNNLFFVDAVERRSGEMRRVRIPLPIVQMAKAKPRAA